jgi:hypothetical protein
MDRRLTGDGTADFGVQRMAVGAARVKHLFL